MDEIDAGPDLQARLLLENEHSAWLEEGRISSCTSIRSQSHQERSIWTRYRVDHDHGAFRTINQDETAIDDELFNAIDDDHASGAIIINPPELSLLLNTGFEKYLLIDSRSFLEYNTSHIQQSVNVCGSKLIKRRLQHDKVQICDLLSQTCHIDVEEYDDVIVYDQCTENPELLTDDNFLFVLLQKLSTAFKRVALLKGGFLAFQAMYPSLCENKANSYHCTALTSLSQPCLPVSNVGPTKILPFLYLGSHQDAMSPDIVQVNEITYVLNVSTTCIKPSFISDAHFLRIPVNDSYNAKLQPYFNDAFQFLDKVREANGCCLVHCLAGISRSPTLAIAYIMKHLNMTSDDAYRYVKDKRPTISPNFNFLGQLLEFEKQLKRDREMNNNCDGPLYPKSDTKLWSNYVMDLSHSPSSPVSKNKRPFVFDTSMSQGLSARQLTHHVSDTRTELESTSDKVTVKSRRFSTEKELPSNVQSSVFPFCKESSVRPSILNLGCEQRRVPGSFKIGLDSGLSMSKSLTDIKELSEIETPSPITTSSSQEVVTTSVLNREPIFAKPLLSPFPCGDTTVPLVTKSIDQIPFSNSDTRNSGCVYKSETSKYISGNNTKYVSVDHSNVSADSLQSTNKQSSSSSLLEMKWAVRRPGLPGSDSTFSFSDASVKSGGKRPLRNSLSLSLSSIIPTSSSPSAHSGEKRTVSSTAEGFAPTACKLERKTKSDLTRSTSSNIPRPSSFSGKLSSFSSSSSSVMSVSTSHVVKLKSFKLSSHLPAQSPTSSLARLHFGTTDSSDNENDSASMEIEQTQSKLPFGEEGTKTVNENVVAGLKFYSFPSTSLDKLNFTPCLSNSSDNLQSGYGTPRVSGIKRPLNNDVLDLKEPDLGSPSSINSSLNSSSNNSCLSSPTSGAGQQKVVVRKREGRAKRTLVRPNSIAFSSYPTFDLGSDCQESPNSSSSAASQDDSSETYIQNGKKSKPSEYMSDVRFRLGRYSEREVYRQITAAMETAMLKSQAFEASRKSRSLDDILSSEDDSSAPNCESSMFDRVLRHCAMRRDRCISSPLLLEKLACGTGHSSGDPYHSNSSLSSTGSHTSLHGSVELIQVS